MDSCPGGGAEIFEKRVRDVICRDKISGERWLEVARLCHENGVKTNVTMLYGSVETVEDRVDHLVRIRELQDETGGFLGFIPLAFHPEETQLPHLPAGDGPHGPERHRGLAPHARQRRPRQGVLGPDRREARARGAPLRRRRPRRAP